MLFNIIGFSFQVETEELIQENSDEEDLLVYFPVNFRSMHAFLGIIPPEFWEFH